MPPTPMLSNGVVHPNAISPALTALNAVPNGVPAASPALVHKLSVANEQTWLLIGKWHCSAEFSVPTFIFDPGGVAEQMGDLEHALSAYENALRHNPMSLSGLTQVAGIARIKENYPKVNPFFSNSSSTFLAGYSPGLRGQLHSFPQQDLVMT